MGVGSGPPGAGAEERVDLSEILKEKLYFAPLPRVEDTAVVQCLPKRAACFNIDTELVYEPFFADFGPLNLACTYRFCWKLHHLLKEADEQDQCVFFCCSADPKKKSNAAVLLGAYLLLFCGVDADAAYAPIAMFEPFLPFRDPTCGISTYRLTVLDCIRAIMKAQRVGWIDFHNFNLEEYEYFEQVENGDLNWIVPNKLMAFSGPSAKRLEIYGYRTLVPEDYVEYFHRVGVTAVVRLNRKAYDRRRFTDHGLSHYDLYFPDGSCPPDRILRRFLEIVEDTPGALAVHCKAGLGRTGALMGCYIMKHFRFTCNETLGYLRIVRPGSVIGPQQHYLKDMQPHMWKAGDVMRHQLAQMNVNSQHYNPPSHEPGPLPSGGGGGWSQGNNRFMSSRKFLSNPNFRRGSVRDRDESGGAQDPHVAEWSPQARFSEPPQRARRKTGGSSHGGTVYKGPTQPRDARPEEDGSGIHRPRHLGTVSPARTGYAQNTAGLAPRGINVTNAMGRLSMNDNPESSASSSSITKKTARASPLRSRAVNHPGRSSLSNAGPGENLGILRNVAGPGPEAQQAGGSVIVQRVINSAGQPRKVVLPVAEVEGHAAQASKFRDGSPARRYGTPGRPNLCQGSRKWDPGQSPYT